MAEYISIPVETDPLEIHEEARAYLQSLIPGWVPADGSLDDWMLSVASRLAADLRGFLTDVPDTIFRYYGEEVLGVLPRLPSYATFSATVTAQDSAGYLLPAGTTVGVRQPSGEYAGFQTVQDYSIPAGQNSVTGVVFAAIEPGAAANGLQIQAVDIDLIDAVTWVGSITGIEATTTGGTDGESPEDYTFRLLEELRLMSPRPILPVDFSVLARRVPGIGRAYFLNLYRADTNTSNVEKAITVVVTDDNGEVASQAARTELLTYLQSVRETNMLIYVASPQYQNITVTYTVTGLPGFEATRIKENVDAALVEYIGPQRWGGVQVGTERVDVWRPNNVVRFYEVVAVVNNAEGVDFINALTINGGTADVTMSPGTGIPVVLPRVVTPISGAVNEVSL